MLRKLPLLLAAIGAVIAAPASAPAETPKRGGILNFAITAETSNYDCHGSQTFALLHPITPFYSLLVKWDATENSQDHRRPRQELDHRAGRPHLHLQPARGRQIPRRLAADLGRHQGHLRAHRQSAARA